MVTLASIGKLVRKEVNGIAFLCRWIPITKFRGMKKTENITDKVHWWMLKKSEHLLRGRVFP